jgi:ABC-type transport system substrate-binding protein
VVPNPEHYTTMPWLATESPIFNDTIDPDWDGETAYRYTIPLREGVQWSDGHIFDAEDVVWTINEIILDPNMGCTATGDFLPIVKRAEYIGNYTPGDVNYNATALNLVLYEPYVDLELILANDWGQAIVPHHYFGGIPPPFESTENKNMNTAKNVPALGPFKYLEEGQPPSKSYVKLTRNEKFFGYNTSIVGSPAWGPYDVDNWIFEYIPEASSRLLNIQLHDSDYGEYPTAPIEVFEGFMDDPNFDAKIDMYPASNPIWFNFNNANVSNRYVRLAIAHVIPYSEIYKDILPSYGVTNPVPGGCMIHPWQYYGGYQLFNTELPLYTYDIAKAQQYLDMAIYARTGTDYTKGCVGDANFDGKVDLDDRWLWGEEFGKPPYTRTLETADWLDPDWYTDYPWPKQEGPGKYGSVAPGNDVDADFDNSGTTGGEDYLLWLTNVGKEYPFSGAF